jgi:Zn-dependent M28 family amino/carboxypeptidase
MNAFKAVVAVLLLGSALARGEGSDVAARLVGAALVGGRSYSTVQSLTDGVGHRLAGTPAGARAVDWAVDTMKRAGLVNVHTEPVTLTTWERGDAWAEILSPVPHGLNVLALGNSVGTAPGGIQAEVVEVTSLEELKGLGERVRGKVVLFNKPMERTQDFSGYGNAVSLRGVGAIEAGRVGAVAALIRSVGTGAYRLPHTGATRYDDGVTKIPYAAVTAEDADLIHRLLQRGERVRVGLRLGCKTGPEVETANVIGEVRGRERPNEIVLLGAHLDSWDVGQGAIDDGAGVAMVIEAARLFASAAPPRRTVRVVLYMNEERGLHGARAYAERHAGELKAHVAAMEADAGAGRPLGFGVTGGDASVAMVREWAAPLDSLRVTDVRSMDHAGADLTPLLAAGVPCVGMLQDMSNYFDWHHTAADTLDKIDPTDLGLATAALTVMAHALANSAERLPPPPAVH